MKSTFPSAAALLCLALASAAHAETLLAQIDLSKDKPGAAPATAAPQPGQTTTAFTTLTTRGNNTLAVADKLGDLKGPVLQFIKADDVNGAPAAVLALQPPIAAGKIRITWNAVIADYQKGHRSQPLEPLLTLNLLGKGGAAFVSLEYLVTNDSGGQFSLLGTDAHLDRWDFKESNAFILDLDLDQQTCTLTIDGKVAAQNAKFLSPGPLRFLQFRDGTGLGAVDGKFTAALSNVKVVQDPK